MERTALFPDPIDARNEIPQTPGRVQVPRPDLVFLRVQIFLAAWRSRCVLAKLVRRTVDPVARAQRGRQNQADHKRRPTSELEIFSKNVGSVRPKIRTEVLSH